ncbi:MAG: MarR family transcriptional regulator [Dermatophilaceae bacterium]
MPPAQPVDTIAEARRLWVEHGWADAADGMAAVTSLMRAQAIVLRRVENALRPMGITFARYEVLMLLYFSQQGSLPMSLIGARLQVHQTSVTNAVDRLEAAAYVRRMPHPTDRRATVVLLTDGGRELAEKATEVLNRDVFREPGLGRSGAAELVGRLDVLRHDAGDF